MPEQIMHSGGSDSDVVSAFPLRHRAQDTFCHWRAGYIAGTNRENVHEFNILSILCFGDKQTE